MPENGGGGERPLHDGNPAAVVHWPMGKCGHCQLVEAEVALTRLVAHSAQQAGAGGGADGEAVGGGGRRLGRVGADDGGFRVAGAGGGGS